MSKPDMLMLSTRTLEKKLSEVVAIERDRCAHVCEAESREWDEAKGYKESAVANECARKIRGGSQNQDNYEAGRRMGLEQAAGICDQAADLYNYETAKECARKIRGGE